MAKDSKEGLSMPKFMFPKFNTPLDAFSFGMSPKWIKNNFTQEEIIESLNRRSIILQEFLK